jgi:tetratricopeptide (TPR) repeat protein
MPAHIQMRTGDYVAAEKTNAEAADVDRAYIRATGAQGMYPLSYYNHNVHFQSAAAAMAGRYEEAKKAADLLYQGVLPAVSMAPEMLEGFLLQPVFVELRFRKWDAIDRMADPGAKLPLARALWLYARGMAAASTGAVEKAETERKAFAAARDGLPSTSMVGMNNSGAAILAVASAVLDAEIARARRNWTGAVESFTKAVALQDALGYDEPAPWYYPVRESLGAALLSGGRAADAERVFREDLDRNPRNPRSLLGLAASLKAQGKSSDAAWVKAQFDVAWKEADIELRLEDL